MAELILPAVQLSVYAWRNIVKALRATNDAHLSACADGIETPLDQLEDHFGPDVRGEVRFQVTATLRPTVEAG